MHSCTENCREPHTHACTHARTHAHTHARTGQDPCLWCLVAIVAAQPVEWSLANLAHKWGTVHLVMNEQRSSGSYHNSAPCWWGPTKPQQLSKVRVLLEAWSLFWHTHTHTHAQEAKEINKWKNKRNKKINNWIIASKVIQQSSNFHSQNVQKGQSFYNCLIRKRGYTMTTWIDVATLI